MDFTDAEMTALRAALGVPDGDPDPDGGDVLAALPRRLVPVDEAVLRGLLCLRAFDPLPDPAAAVSAVATAEAIVAAETGRWLGLG